ncbi:hypothetical protein RI367_000707 [Sorochytrium milnesiophthora]
MERRGRMAYFRDVHTANIRNAHSIDFANPYFLLWHRSFLMDFEAEFVAASGGLLSGLPYYDFSVDAANPRAAAVWSADLLGSLGQCVGDPFSNWRMGGSCLRRELPRGWDSCHPNVLTQQLRETSFVHFSHSIEMTCHRDIHNSFDGDMRPMTTSTQDPFFYPMHAGFDFYFAQWQRQENNAVADGGVDLNHRLLGRTVAQLIKHDSGEGCYTYGDAPGSTPSQNATASTPPPTKTTASSPATATPPAVSQPPETTPATAVRGSSSAPRVLASKLITAVVSAALLTSALAL